MNKIEQKIFRRFNEKGADVVGAKVDSSNFELKQILNFFGVPTFGVSKLLDVGSGKGKFTDKLNKLGFTVIGVEPSFNLLRIAEDQYPNLQFVQASATSLPFSDNEFNFLICIEVLEHIPDTEQAIKEMVRVLKPGGKMIIIDKNINSLHPIYFVPTRIWKSFLENTNRWMYPKDFPFREKYFVPSQLNGLIKRYCSQSDVVFVQFVSDSKKRSLIKRIVWDMHSAVSGILHRALPFLDFYIVWRAIK